MKASLVSVPRAMQLVAWRDQAFITGRSTEIPQVDGRNPGICSGLFGVKRGGDGASLGVHKFSVVFLL